MGLIEEGGHFKLIVHVHMYSYLVHIACVLGAKFRI